MGSSSLLQLRRSVGDHTGEMLLLTATAVADTDAGQSPLRTIRDEVRLGARGDNAPSLINRIGYFANGSSNDGHEVRTDSFHSPTRALFFTPGAANPVAVGDEMELWSIADRAGGIGTIHRLINEAIRSVPDLAGVETYDTSQRWTYRSPSVTIPETWAYIGGIEWDDGRGGISDIRIGDAVVRPGRRTVEITGRGSRLANGKYITLWGHLRSVDLVNDTDETQVDSEWIVESVISALSLAQSWKASDRAAEERRSNFWASRAADFRRKVGAPRRGWMIPLP